MYISNILVYIKGRKTSFCKIFTFFIANYNNNYLLSRYPACNESPKHLEGRLNYRSVHVQFNGARAFLFTRVCEFCQLGAYSQISTQLHLSDKTNLGGHCVEMVVSGEENLY